MPLPFSLLHLYSDVINILWIYCTSVYTLFDLIYFSFSYSNTHGYVYIMYWYRYYYHYIIFIHISFHIHISKSSITLFRFHFSFIFFIHSVVLYSVCFISKQFYCTYSNLISRKLRFLVECRFNFDLNSKQQTLYIQNLTIPVWHCPIYCDRFYIKN
jgi:hypothetical protein